MKRIVIKFGGTSVGSIEKIVNAAKIIKKRHEEGNQIIVVVSAMSGTTNDLINRSKKISGNFDKSELDVKYYWDIISRLLEKFSLKTWIKKNPPLTLIDRKQQSLMEWL